MYKLKEMREKRMELVHQQRDLYERAKKEERTLTTDEEQQFDKIESDLAELRRSIELEEKLIKNLQETENQQRQQEDKKPEDYQEVFTRYLRYGAGSLTPEHRQVLVQNRGTDPQSSTDAEGGYTIPQGFSNQLYVEMAEWGGMLQAGRIWQTSTGNPVDWPTLDDTGNTSSLIAENTEVTVNDLTFGNKVLNAYNYTSGMIKVPVTLMQDSAFDLERYIREAFARRLGTGINAALTTGDGSSKPQGVVPAAGTGLTAAATGAVTRDELVDLLHSVDPVHRRNGRFMFNDATLAAIKKLAFGTSDDRPLWQAGSIQNGEPDRLEGKPYTINQDMVNMAAGTRSILFGDFDKYIIRLAGPAVYVRLNELFMDSLQVGFLAYQRVDGELLSSNAIKAVVQAAS